MKEILKTLINSILDQNKNGELDVQDLIILLNYIGRHVDQIQFKEMMAALEHQPDFLGGKNASNNEV